MSHEGELLGGPQDGAKVMSGSGHYPQELYVGPKWLGDGYAAWSRHPSAEKPARYWLESVGPAGRYVYRFMGYRTEG